MAEKHLDTCMVRLESSPWRHLDLKPEPSGGALVTVSVEGNGEQILFTTSDELVFDGDTRDLHFTEMDVWVKSFKLVLAEASLGPLIEFLRSLQVELQVARDEELKGYKE